MKCKFVERNRIEKKCFDYYKSYSNNQYKIKCRIVEWKQKKDVCPYDSTIFSVPKKTKKDLKEKKQRTLSPLEAYGFPPRGTSQ